MGHSNRSIVGGIAIFALLGVGACSSETRPTADGGVGGASGNGGQSGAVGGSAGGQTGGAGNGGGVDAGSCRLQGQSCTAPQRCCGPLICAGVCTMGVSGETADAALAICTYPDGGAPIDGSAFNGSCPSGGCPSGTVCVRELGGVAGFGGEYCAPIPNECHGTPTCACMADCVCTHRFGGLPELCSDQNGSIDCNDRIL